MRFSLRTKLSVSYVFVTILLVCLISILTTLLVEKQFKNYIVKQQSQRNKDIVAILGQQYADTGWSRINIETIGMNALEQGIIIKVKDAVGNTIWDATTHNKGLCTQMLSHMAENMKSYHRNFNGGYVEEKYPVKRNSLTVGSVEIGYYGPYYFNDNDLAFINTLNTVLIAAGIISLIIALLLGAYMARRLSTPISRVIASAGKLSKGHFEERINEDTTTKEIKQLTSTINNLAETLEKEELLRKRMGADVAHELRTPLATLQSHMEAMIDGIWKPETDRLKSCHEEILRINRLVGDIEKLAMFENENVILNKSEFDIFELISNIVRNFETDFKNKEVAVSFSGENEKITADRDKISQVVVNLVSNALKYTPEGGKVEISVDGTENASIIIVRDNGIGISPEDLKYIFERFYRADKSRNRLTGGSGIGLTIAKAIVEAHKGVISVKSKPGEGTEFVVALPKQAD